MVNKERVQEWLDALRSGKYKQATGNLKVGDCFCVLGLACQISKKGKWVDEGYYLADGQRETFTWPPAVAEYYGLPEDIMITYEGFEHSMTHANDMDGLSFEELADLIEDQYVN